MSIDDALRQIVNREARLKWYQKKRVRQQKW